MKYLKDKDFFLKIGIKGKTCKIFFLKLSEHLPLQGSLNYLV